MSKGKVTVALVGANGSIGRRYRAILKRLGINVFPYDMEEAIQDGKLGKSIVDHKWDQAIIACPTDQHFMYAQKLQEAKRVFLCEKPLSKSPSECRSLANGYPCGYVVNNYGYVAYSTNRSRPFQIEYDYYNTGQDGTFFDACQLVYLDPWAHIETASPIWTLKISGELIPYRRVEESYIEMIRDFVNLQSRNLWDLVEGLHMTMAVLDRMNKEGQFARASWRPGAF